MLIHAFLRLVNGGVRVGAVVVSGRVLRVAQAVVGGGRVRAVRQRRVRHVVVYRAVSTVGYWVVAMEKQNSFGISNLNTYIEKPFNKSHFFSVLSSTFNYFYTYKQYSKLLYLITNSDLWIFGLSYMYQKCLSLKTKIPNYTISHT